MSFLQQKHPLIRSQLVPVAVEFDGFFDGLFKFITEFLKEPLNPNQQLEIEVKLGAFFQREIDKQGFQQYLDSFQIITQLNHAIINSYQQHYNFQPCFYPSPWSQQYFSSVANPQSFQFLKSYLNQLCDKQYHQTYENKIFELYVDPNNTNNLTKSHNFLRLDIHFGIGDRGSISFSSKGITSEILRKRRLGDLDIMKGESQFRITGQIETIQDKGTLQYLLDRIQSEEQIRSIRFKSSTTLKFEFIRIDISRVHQLGNESIGMLQNGFKLGWQNFLLQMLRSLHDVDDWEQEKDKLQPNKRVRVLENKRKQEVEFEIVDLEFVKQHPDTCIKRLLRNVDSFFHIDQVHRDLLMMKIQERLPTISKQAWQPPLIGHYQLKIYNKHHKIYNKLRKPNNKNGVKN